MKNDSQNLSGFIEPGGNLTFFQTRETEDLDETEVVTGRQHGAAVVGIYGVDVVDVGVLGPDPTDFWPDDTRPGNPVDPLGLLFGCHMLPSCTGEIRKTAQLHMNVQPLKPALILCNDHVNRGL